MLHRIPPVEIFCNRIEILVRSPGASTVAAFTSVTWIGHCSRENSTTVVTFRRQTRSDLYSDSAGHGCLKKGAIWRSKTQNKSHHHRERISSLKMNRRQRAE